MSGPGGREPAARILDSSGGQFVGAFAAILLFASYWFFQVAPLLDTQGTGIVGRASHANDFKHLYVGGRLLAAGQSPYDPANIITMAVELCRDMDLRFCATPEDSLKPAGSVNVSILPYVYTPMTGLAMYPVIALPFATSVVAFQVINHLAVLGGLLLAAALAGWRHNFWSAAIVVAMVAFNTSLHRQNNAGQLNAILLGGFAVVYIALLRGWHPSLVGFMVGFLAWFKITPGILLFYFLLRRQWQHAAWTFVMMVGVGLVTMAAVGPRTMMDFLPVAGEMGYGKSTWSQFGHTFYRDPANQSINAMLHRLMVEHPKFPGTQPWVSASPAVANGMTWVVTLALLAGLGCGIHRSRGASSPAAGYSLAVCLSLLVPSIMWDHYLIQVLLPIVVLAPVAWEGRARWLYIALLGMAAVLVSVPVPFWSPGLQSGAGLLLQNLKLLPVLLVAASALLLIRENAAATRVDSSGSGALTEYEYAHGEQAR